MTEDELLYGVIGALDLAGWRWHHVRRSDKAQQMGTPGFPDIVAVHPDRHVLFVAEIKSETGRMRPGQPDWLAAFQYATSPDDWVDVLRPKDYDRALAFILGRVA